MNEWNEWLHHQRKEYSLDSDTILKESIFFNALNAAGIANPPYSPQPVVSYWNGLDSPDAYQRHLDDPDARNKLAQLGWIDADIRYELNSWGFRSNGCAEFDYVTEPSLITMGCSFTFGTGLPQHTIWPQLAADGLGLRLVNLGTPGHGLAMNTHWLLTQGHCLINPKAIVVYLPPPGRMTWYQLVPGFPPNTYHLQGNTFAMTQWDRILPIKNNMAYNGHMDYVKNYHAIKLWAQSRNIPLHVFTGSEGDPNSYGLARDLAHQGVGWHRALANKILSRLKIS